MAAASQPFACQARNVLQEGATKMARHDAAWDGKPTLDVQMDHHVKTAGQKGAYSQMFEHTS